MIMLHVSCINGIIRLIQKLNKYKYVRGVICKLFYVIIYAEFHSNISNTSIRRLHVSFSRQIICRSMFILTVIAQSLKCVP